ncbi:hypothetical protein [Frankia sp. Cr1]|uniref:hypothetical protein n=1 Tax=Frankia sp. Cr1 TaxID=3073931 RepID=UPI002AD23504|nr:hypothetical protein [Frankia sp. Cr1]
MRRFTPRSPDGRSEAQVVVDLVLDDLSPGEVLTYDTLLTQLDRDDIRPVYKAVAEANKRLRRDHQRSLVVVPGKGYRLLHAHEHPAQADERRTVARRRVAEGVMILRATRLGELSEAARQAVVGQVVIYEGLQAQLDHQDQRLRRQEDVLASVARRVEALETGRTAGTSS